MSDQEVTPEPIAVSAKEFYDTLYAKFRVIPLSSMYQSTTGYVDVLYISGVAQFTFNWDVTKCSVTYYDSGALLGVVPLTSPGWENQVARLVASKIKDVSAIKKQEMQHKLDRLNKLEAICDSFAQDQA